MTKTSPKDIGASVRARLLRLARERGDDFQLLLTRYANERLLFRLSTSRHAAGFVLKGAALFTIWTGEPHRATRDIDLLGFGDPGERRILDIFTDVLAPENIFDDDGVRFDIDSLAVGPIREEQAYGGVRVEMVAHITNAEVHIQVDVGFGDAITPDAVLVDFPPLLDFPAPRLRAYPRETVVAEKLEAIVQLGMANSRMKDYFDLAVLARSFEFDNEILSRAIYATFERRKTPLPKDLPIGLTDAFTQDAMKQSQWAGFIRKSGVRDAGTLAETVVTITAFIKAPLSAARNVSRGA